MGGQHQHLGYLDMLGGGGGIEGYVVGRTIMFGDKTHKGVVVVDGAMGCLVGLCIDNLRMDKVVGIANGGRDVIAHAETKHLMSDLADIREHMQGQPDGTNMFWWL